MDIQTIAATIGRKRIADGLGVSRAAVSNAISRGQFPAHWLPVVTALCAEAGIDCPIELFNWRSSGLPVVSGLSPDGFLPADNNGDAPAGMQGGAE